MIRLFCIFLLVSGHLSAQVIADTFKQAISEDLSYFSGRFSRLNPKSGLVRVKLDFDNAKYLMKGDKVEFWSSEYASKRCIGEILGKSSEYILMKVPNYDVCINKVGFTVGSYIHFQSDDLKNNLIIGGQLLEVILKKRLAIQSMLERNKKDIAVHIDRVEAINKRYEVLRKKLELEWEEQLSLLEADKAEMLKQNMKYQDDLDDLDKKIELYRINDKNIKLDRWSLDPFLYYKK